MPGDRTFTASPTENCYLDHVSTTLASMRGCAGALQETLIFPTTRRHLPVELKNVTSSQTLSFAFVEAEAPVIDAQPQDTSVREGESATLSVAADAAQSVRDHEAMSSGASASHELTYQWYRVGENGQSTLVEGANSATLEVQDGDAGEYYCQVTQLYLGTVTTVESNQCNCHALSPKHWYSMLPHCPQLPPTLNIKLLSIPQREVDLQSQLNDSNIL